MDLWQMLWDAVVGAGLAALALTLAGFISGGISMLFDNPLGRGALVAGAALGIIFNAGTLFV